MRKQMTALAGAMVGLTWVAFAQQPANDTVKFQASTLLVVEMVSVKDKSGNIVEGVAAMSGT